MTDEPWLLAVVAAARPVLAREAFNQAADAIETLTLADGFTDQDRVVTRACNGLIAHVAELVRGLGGETQ
jgi:hypothetical protein